MKHLFNEFSPTNAEDWKARLEKDLKGITFDALSVKDRNDITIHPFYTHEDIDVVNIAGRTQPGWSICEHIIVEDAVTANKQALEALNNGANGLCFILTKEVDAATLLHEIELPYIYTCFDVNGCNAFTEKLQEYLNSKNWSLADMECFVSNDFIGNYLESGVWGNNFESDSQSFLSGFETTKQINIQAALFQNAGSNSITELACVIAQVNEYLHLLDASNKIASLQKIQITIATDTNFYEQIAKLRALRNVLQLLLEQYGLHTPLHLNVETSNIYRSPFDSYSNLLRDTLAGMAAVLGGCNSLYIHPFNETLEMPTAFSKRMSRNQQLIFKEESYLDKVADVAAGSYYIEQLTAQLSQKAWEAFKQTEADGGLIASFEKGKLKQAIENQAQQLILEYKEGKRVLIGVNKFPNAKDAPIVSTKQQKDSKGIQAILLSNEIL
jgi:methylmalonyl-CoA mutase